MQRSALREAGRRTLAEIAAAVAVAQRDRLARAGRCFGRHGGAAYHAGLEQDIAFNSRIVAGTDYLAAGDLNNSAQFLSP